MNPLNRLIDKMLDVFMPPDAMQKAYIASRAEAALVADEEVNEVAEPAAVQSLGVDERDRRWRSAHGSQWKWENGRWWCRELENTPDGIWMAAPWDYLPQSDPPYIEVIETPIMDWQGWAVPAILEVLAEHVYEDFEYDDASCICLGRDKSHLDETEWREHVAPIIADRIACDPQRAIEALKHYKVST